MDPTGLLGDGDALSKLIQIAPIAVILTGLLGVSSWWTKRIQKEAFEQGQSSMKEGIRIGQKLRKDEQVEEEKL